MELEEAKKLLDSATRHELRDHAFGDTEVYWVLGKKEIACGYFGGGQDGVSVFKPAEDSTSFSGEEARVLRECGTLGDVERNDETGPNEFIEGKTEPGLTLEGVREELTRG
jgi:hypothetical protein